VVQLLQTTEGSIVEVAITEDSCLVGIYYQEADMQKTFAEFPELLVIDSTNRLTDLHMQLYVLMVVDGNCRSEVVATFLSANNTRDTFRHVTQTFMLHNPAHENIRAVMIDKDATEQQVLREELPNACLEDEFVESFKGSHALSENRSIDKLESVNEKIKVVCSRYAHLLLR
jgi:MULE transposase domain